MKIEEIKIDSPKPTKLQRLQSRKFTIELDGAQLLALAIVANKVAGSGVARETFSNRMDSIIELVPDDIDDLADELIQNRPANTPELATGSIRFHPDWFEDYLK
jgi:hypothetical protein